MPRLDGDCLTRRLAVYSVTYTTQKFVGDAVPTSWAIAECPGDRGVETLEGDRLGDDTKYS
jgi:hypothetical protein